MQIVISPLLKKDPKYEVDQKKFRKMMKIKRVAQRYDDQGKKTIKLEDHKVKYKKTKGVMLKHEKLQGPFAVVTFRTDSDIKSKPVYTYCGYIYVEDGEYAYVYRDSLIDGYTEAYWCDDTTLLMDVRNKETKEKIGIQIDGEPTGIASWNFESNDDAGFTGKKAILARIDQVAEELKLPKDKVYGVIQLDC